MKIEFTQDFRQYKTGDKYEFENYSFITGINGSGKSNLLRAINSMSEGILIDGKPRKLYNVHHYDHTSINVFSSRARVGTTVRQNDYYLSSIYSEHQDYLAGKKEEEEISERLEKFAKKLGKELHELTRKDFVETPLVRNDDTKLFNLNFFEDAGNYISWKEQNVYNDFRNKNYGENNLVFTEDEFINRFKMPPWQIINDALENTEFKYRFLQPEKHYRRGYLNLSFYDIVLKEEIPLEYLSYGERIIITFITSLYDSIIINEYPEILLFDEVDAFLHPSFSRDLIEIIQAVFIRGLDCKVLFVTHSPSTIAIAPSNNIYLCERENREIKKVTKDNALGRLTEGINYLSVNYENIRQVFVEDEDDVLFYSSIYNLVSDKLPPNISVNFIAVSRARKENTGGSAKVKSIVKELWKNGNKTVFGIVDFDNKNTSHSPIFTLTNRYSIENYIFDPIYVIIYLLKDKLITYRSLNLVEPVRYFEIEKFDDARLQELVDAYLREIMLYDTEDQIEAEYCNGRKILIPKKYLFLNGHELEDAITKINPKIFGKKKGYRSLKSLMIEDVIKIFPGFIPKEFVELYESIQKG